MKKLSHLINFKPILGNAQKTFVITGAGGFIGVNLLHALLENNQKVIGIDNFLTGHKKNINDILNMLPPEKQALFTFHEGNIEDASFCMKALKGADIILHQAALGSVPRSVEDPLASYKANLFGSLSLFLAAKELGIKRIVYASSSSVYGDDPRLPKVEGEEGRVLSPYAATKKNLETLCQAFGHCYDLEFVGLRYFNVFGPLQDPNGAYAAVIPKWIEVIKSGNAGEIYGDGTTSRDFCYIDNVIEANLLCALTENKNALNQVYNIACSAKLSLRELYALLAGYLGQEGSLPFYKEKRMGDIDHSFADITKAKELLGYQGKIDVKTGLEKTVQWYLSKP